MVSSYYKDIYELLCKKHPNQKVYVISDHHFYHSNIIKYQRPIFEDVLKMNEYIINVHNMIVEKNDIVIFFGDFSFKKTAIKDCLSKMNGHKYLLLGNHDDENLIYCYGKLGFEGIFTNPVKINNKFLSHYPLCENEIDNINFKLLVQEFNNSDGINYHGHTHTKEFNNKSFVNVCCEIQDYKPLFIGYTKKVDKSVEAPLIINSEYFEDILINLKKDKNLDANLLISDYIYSMLLESTMTYIDHSFVYGSFPLYKKYGFISNFLDLDVCLEYDENISKNQNKLLLKKLFDTSFECAKDIDNLNLSFEKRISCMCIFELLYTNKLGNVYRGYYDTNLITLDVYRDTDFITTYDCSILEKMLRNETDLLNNFKFPRYKSRYLTVAGDIANIMLQILFQREGNEKKILALKKLKYIYKNLNISNVSNLEDVMTRFFIRNVLFFHMTRRRKDIDYISANAKRVDSLIEKVPSTLKIQIEEMLKNPHSLFNTIYDELINVKFDEIPQKSKELIKSIKQ